jgi:hypothetical protein
MMIPRTRIETTTGGMWPQPGSSRSTTTGRVGLDGRLVTRRSASSHANAVTPIWKNGKGTL